MEETSANEWHPLSVEDTLSLGASVAEGLEAGAVLGLMGRLGSGKTHFVKGLARGLGCVGEVTSPTFTLVHEYTGGRLPLFHLDLYRLESEEELWAIGWEEYLDAGGVIAVEWADKFPAVLPEMAQWWRFEVEETGTRTIRRVDAPETEEAET